MNEVETFGFEKALSLVKEGKTVSRLAWSRSTETSITMKAQYSDINSKMTEPYLYMEKVQLKDIEHGITKRFPLDLSAESVFAEDWVKVFKA